MKLTAEVLDEFEESSTGAPKLRARCVRRRAQSLLLEQCTSAHRGHSKTREAREKARLSDRRLCDDRPVPEESEEIEEPSPESQNPQPHGQPTNADAPTGVSEALAAEHGPNGGEDDLYAAHLPRQRIERKDALTVPAPPAARERYAQHHKPRKPVKFPQNARTREHDPIAAAHSAPAVGQKRRPRIGDDRLVSGRVHSEYVNHVLGLDGPGVREDIAGAVFFVPEHASAREKLAQRPGRSTLNRLSWRVG